MPNHQVGGEAIRTQSFQATLDVPQDGSRRDGCLRSSSGRRDQNGQDGETRMDWSCAGPGHSDGFGGKVRHDSTIGGVDPFSVPGQSQAVACRSCDISAGPSGAPPLVDVVAAVAAVRDRGSGWLE